MSRVRIIRAGKAATQAAPTAAPAPAPVAAAPVDTPRAPALQVVERAAERIAPHVFAERRPGIKRVLNSGSGEPTARSLHAIFRSADWEETRLDIDNSVRPDIVSSVVDMAAAVPTGSVDAVWSSHTIEHLFEPEVERALVEFRRVLAPGGFVLITCPDLEEVARLVLEKGLDAEAYRSPAGPIRPYDMLFGHGPAIRAGNTFMAHKSGFTVDTLGRALLKAGFAEVRAAKGPGFNLWALGCTEATDHAALERMLRLTTEAFLVEDEAA